MPQRIRVDDRPRATESKFYLPAGDTESAETNPVKRLWAALFNHGIETPA